jgi:hypothetical protein
VKRVWFYQCRYRNRMRGEFNNESAHCWFGPGHYKIRNPCILDIPICSSKISVWLQGVNVSTKDFSFSQLGKYIMKIHLFHWDYVDCMIPKKFAKPQSQIQNIYFRIGKNKFKVPSLKIISCIFIITFVNMLFPMLQGAAEWLHLLRYFTTGIS